MAIRERFVFHILPLDGPTEANRPWRRACYPSCHESSNFESTSWFRKAVGGCESTKRDAGGGYDNGSSTVTTNEHGRRSAADRSAWPGCTSPRQCAGPNVNAHWSQFPKAS